MPRKNLTAKSVDKRYDKMSLEEVEELFKDGTEEEKKEYIAYITRKAHQARSLFNAGHRKKSSVNIDEINREWEEKKKNNVPEEKEIIDFDNFELNASEVKDAEEMKNNETSSSDKLTNQTKEFRKKYKIDINTVIDSLETVVKGVKSKVVLTKYKGPKRYYDSIIDDKSKSAFYINYKNIYKTNLSKALKTVAKNKTLKSDAKSIADFTNSYDYIVRHNLLSRTNVMAPSLGGITKKEFVKMIDNIFAIKYTDDNVFNDYLTSNDEAIESLKTKEVNEIFDKGYTSFVEVLKNSKFEEDVNLRTERSMESIAKIYNTLSRVSNGHGFWYSLFHPSQINKEKQVMDVIKKTTIAVFKKDGNNMSVDQFNDYLGQKLTLKPCIVFSDNNPLVSLYNVKSTTGLEDIKEDDILEEEAELEEENERRPIDVSNDAKENNINTNSINIINEANVVKDKENVK